MSREKKGKKWLEVYITLSEIQIIGNEMRYFRNCKNLYCNRKTDIRRSIDGLMAIIRDTYQMGPYANALTSNIIGTASCLFPTSNAVPTSCDK